MCMLHYLQLEAHMRAHTALNSCIAHAPCRPNVSTLLPHSSAHAKLRLCPAGGVPFSLPPFHAHTYVPITHLDQPKYCNINSTLWLPCLLHPPGGAGGWFRPSGLFAVLLSSLPALKRALVSTLRPDHALEDEDAALCSLTLLEAGLR